MFQSALIAKVCLTAVAAADAGDGSVSIRFDREGVPHFSRSTNKPQRLVSIRFDREGVPHGKKVIFAPTGKVSIRFDREGVPHGP